MEPTTGVHIVTVPSSGMVCYLQPDWIVRPLKAAVGEDVLTPYGEGRVECYKPDSDIYGIRLRWGGKLYGKADRFDRIDGIQDGESGFGIKWLMNYFYSKNTAPARSRSNSIASGSISNRSGT